MKTFAEKKEILHEIIKNGGKPAVAFSGGVDSSLLLFLAATLRKGDVLGIFAITNAQSHSEKEKAIGFCKDHNIPLETVSVDIFAKEAVAKNHRDRCYHCKTLILEAVKEKAMEKSCTRFFDGSIADDKEEYRPGEKALREADIISPLALSELTKTNVRNYACDLELQNWNKPSKPCLLTRFPYDMQESITAERIAQIEKGEEILNLLCRHNFRLRWEGINWARIEASKEDIETIISGSQGLLEAMEHIGFSKVTLDLRPFKSGSYDRE